MDQGNSRNGEGKGWRPPAALALGALLLLLGAAWLLPLPPSGRHHPFVTAARAAFVLLSTALSLATLGRSAGLWGGGRPPGTGPFPPPSSRPSGDSSGSSPAELEERNRELLAHHRITKKMMRARTSGSVFRVLLEGLREELSYPGAVMAFLDFEGHLVFPPSPGGEGKEDFPGTTIPAVSAGESFFFPLLEREEPAFFDGVPVTGGEEYRSVSHDGKSLVIPLLHRGWTGDQDGEGEGNASLPEGIPRFRPALVVLRSVPGGKEVTPAAIPSVVALLNEAEVALEMTDLYRRLRSLSVTDGLTGLLNHREFYDRLAREAERARRYSHSISVILLDVDDFKGYNDRYGHPAGDNVLRILASLLRQSARGTDIVARYGGEEFAVILPESTSTGALLMAERIRTALSAINLSPTPEGDVRLTASLGIFTSEKGDVSVDTMVAMADDALYRAKKDGKNRVIVRAGK